MSKLQMLLQTYFVKRLNMFSTFIILVCLFMTFKISVMAKTPQVVKSPGALESLEYLVKINTDIYKKLKIKSRLNPLKLTDLNKLGAKSVSLHPEYLSALLFNSEEKYLSLIQGEQGECVLYSLMENRLIKTPEGINNLIILNVRKKDKDIIASTSIENFLKFMYGKQCYSFKQISSVFTLKHYLKTLDMTKKPMPKNNKHCLEIMADWKKNFHLPYLCKIVETIKLGSALHNKIKNKVGGLAQISDSHKQILIEAKNYRRALSVFEKSYYGNVCNNITTPMNFCTTYLAKNVWDEVIRGEKPIAMMKYRCKALLKGAKLTRDNLEKCKKILENDPDICTTSGIKKFPSLFPKPNCNQIERAYRSARLNIDYQDCPARVDYLTATNVSRVLNHYFPRKNQQSTPETCKFETFLPFAETIMHEKDEEIQWPLSICHKNLATKEEECHHFIPGHFPESRYSEERVIAYTLSKIKGASPSEVCQIVDKDKFNPIFLEFKSGCFIVSDKKRCGGINCKPQIFYRGKHVKNVTYKTEIGFEYYPLNYLREKFSINNILKKNHALRINKIHNITIMKNYFKEQKTGIIFGLGCVQDLLPQFFQINALNDCIPTPFIIDGFDKNEENILLSMRTPMDDLHSPRLVDWNLVFNAVSNFRSLHPLNTWTLNGIKTK